MDFVSSQAAATMGASQFTMPDTSLAEDLFLERQRHWREYLERENRVNSDVEELQRMVAGGALGSGGDAETARLVVSVDHVREFDTALAAALVTEPGELIPALEAAATEALHALAAAAGIDAGGVRVAAGFRGAFGAHHLTPRGLRAALLGQLVCVEGIVTRCSLVRPKVVRSVHYAEATKTFYAKTYVDATTSMGGAGPQGAMSSAYPTADDKGNALTTEFGFSRYADHQTVNIQEMPERAPPGQLPRGVDVLLDGDLVDAVKPGDRVALVGVYRALGGRATTAASAIFRTVLVANAVRVFGAGSLAAGGGSAREVNARAAAGGVPGALALTDSDIRNIRAVAKRGDAYELLAQSLAPSICGHAEIKRAMLLQLLGGCEKNLDNGTHIRGDINVLMVGDPSTAKSQVLRYVLRIAPLAIATTGRGSSGVGLTAAVVSDKDTGERRLEAGAMVLADRGVVCIDEFDKMTDMDRVAIHEVMEQQTVTVAKAGIHTTLNARCSVLAAANPVYGRYDPKRPPHHNIALPDSLLSRFDLLFIVTDSMDEARDRMISAHVLRMHRYVPPGTDAGQPEADLLDQGLGTAQLLADAGADGDAGARAARACAVFEPYNEYLHAGVAAAAASRHRTRSRRGELSPANAGGDAVVAPKREVLSTEFLRRFLYFAKNMVRPVLGDAAADDLAAAYAELRAQASGQVAGANAVLTTAPVTARTLETLIRLATAHAKLRLSPTVDAQDADVAKALLRFALFKEQAAKPPQAAAAAASKQSKRARMLAGAPGSQPQSSQSAPAAADMDLQDDSMDVDQDQGQNPDQDPASAAPLSVDRTRLFRFQLSRAIADRRLDESESPWAFPDTILPAVNAGISQPFSAAEAELALLDMERENRLMFRDGVVIMM
ncbi:MCM DNA helicase complex subunit [Kickxella alabastrina]|uniref:MCM DNA helicase complex subunit n=1 Tax=Kickxella alabastrina TaxID=61397 RepID=A0ACC1III1_9FUNG|nr:MCM DNA helicase complex subunit [Kickxella alabastrina]